MQRLEQRGLKKKPRPILEWRGVAHADGSALWAAIDALGGKRIDAVTLIDVDGVTIDAMPASHQAVQAWPFLQLPLRKHQLWRDGHGADDQVEMLLRKLHIRKQRELGEIRREREALWCSQREEREATVRKTAEDWVQTTCNGRMVPRDDWTEKQWKEYEHDVREIMQDDRFRLRRLWDAETHQEEARAAARIEDDLADERQQLCNVLSLLL